MWLRFSLTKSARGKQSCQEATLAIGCGPVAAAKLAARYAFENDGLIRVEVVMAVDNSASRRVAEKSGAQYQGILGNRMVVGRDVYNAHMYSLIPEDFGLAPSL